MQPERQIARALGMNRYFTGKPCKNGHIAERWVSKAKCVQCSAEREHAMPPEAKEEMLEWKRANGEDR